LQGFCLTGGPAFSHAVDELMPNFAERCNFYPAWHRDHVKDAPADAPGSPKGLAKRDINGL